MKIIYGALLAQLKTEVPELKWIDLDEGQLDGNGGERPAIAFPAALIGINFLKCDTIYVVNCFQKFVSLWSQTANFSYSSVCQLFAADFGK